MVRIKKGNATGLEAQEPADEKGLENVDLRQKIISQPRLVFFFNNKQKNCYSHQWFLYRLWMWEAHVLSSSSIQEECFVLNELLILIHLIVSF